MSATSTLRNPRPKDPKFKATLGNSARPHSQDKIIKGGDDVVQGYSNLSASVRLQVQGLEPQNQPNKTPIFKNCLGREIFINLHALPVKLLFSKGTRLV